LGIDEAKDVAEAFLKDHGVRTVRIGLTDLDGIHRGKRIPVKYFLDSVWRKGSNICDILFGWDVADEPMTNLAFTGWHTGGGGSPQHTYRLGRFAIVLDSLDT